MLSKITPFYLNFILVSAELVLIKQTTSAGTLSRCYSSTGEAVFLNSSEGSCTSSSKQKSKLLSFNSSLIEEVWNTQFDKGIFLAPVLDYRWKSFKSDTSQFFRKQFGAPFDQWVSVKTESMDIVSLDFVADTREIANLFIISNRDNLPKLEKENICVILAASFWVHFHLRVDKTFLTVYSENSSDCVIKIPEIDTFSIRTAKENETEWKFHNYSFFLIKQRGIVHIYTASSEEDFGFDCLSFFYNFCSNCILKIDISGNFNITKKLQPPVFNHWMFFNLCDRNIFNPPFGITLSADSYFDNPVWAISEVMFYNDLGLTPTCLTENWQSLQCNSLSGKEKLGFSKTLGPLRKNCSFFPVENYCINCEVCCLHKCFSFSDRGLIPLGQAADKHFPTSAILIAVILVLIAVLMVLSGFLLYYKRNSDRLKYWSFANLFGSPPEPQNVEYNSGYLTPINVKEHIYEEPNFNKK